MSNTEERQNLSSEDFRNVMGHFASGVTVITTSHDGVPHGATASAVTSLSLEPPMLLVCINKSSDTRSVIQQAGRFAVNILGEDVPDLAMRFARKGEGKFENLQYSEGEAGIPLLDGAIAAIECTVEEETEGGTHTVFIARAQHATMHPGPPLAYFQGRFGRIEMEPDIQAARLIQKYILDNDLVVGERVDLEELADVLEVPRGVVYHALGSLRDQGVVYRDEGGEFRVATLSMQMVVEALEARRTIELGVVATLIESATPEQISALRAAANRTRQDGEGRILSESEWAQANHEFHNELVNLSSNRSLVNVYKQFNLTAILGRVQHDLGGHDRRELDAGSEHLALVDALEKHDPDAAAAAISRHVDEAVASVKKMFTEQVQA